MRRTELTVPIACAIFAGMLLFAVIFVGIRVIS